MFWIPRTALTWHSVHDFCFSTACVLWSLKLWWLHPLLQLSWRVSCWNVQTAMLVPLQVMKDSCHCAHVVALERPFFLQWRQAERLCRPSHASTHDCASKYALPPEVDTSCLPSCAYVPSPAAGNGGWRCHVSAFNVHACLGAAGG